jgi:putative Holliday junction resolvase
MSRVLGVDYGTRRIGLALSDPMGMFASALEVVENRGEAISAEEVLRVARERGAGKIVVGLPRNMNGTEGPSAAAARAFAGRLAGGGADVELWDERMTTVTAQQTLIESGTRRNQRRGVVDKIAAQVLLQHWLDGRNPPPEREDS